MALIREIIDCLCNQSEEVIDWRWINVRDAVTRPVVANGAYLSFVPGCFDAANATLSATIKGCSFIRGRDDAVWRPKEDIDLVGSWSFVNSQRFLDFGNDVSKINPEESRQLAMMALSDLLNKDGKADRLFSRQYCDFPLWEYDFEDLQDQLDKFGYLGFIHDRGHWKGVSSSVTGMEVVSAKVCALALLESLNSEQALRHVYLDVSNDDYERLNEGVSNDDLGMRELKSATRNIVRRGKVRLLLFEERIQVIRGALFQNAHEELKQAFAKIECDYGKAVRKWRRDCYHDIALREIKLRYGMI